jgi:hypothetical protein
MSEWMPSFLGAYWVFERAHSSAISAFHADSSAVRRRVVSRRCEARHITLHDIHTAMSAQPQPNRSPTMNTTSIKVLATIVAAHVVVFAAAGSALQKQADVAMLPVVKAERIVVVAAKQTTNLAVAFKATGAKTGS